MGELKRTLGVAEVIFFGTGSILGAGIYAIVGKVAGYGGNMMWLSFLISAFTALMTAFSYAELVSIFPRAGGEYVYLKQAMNKKMAIVTGLLISANGIVSGATVSLAFAGYLSQLLEVPIFMGASGVILIIWLVNVAGIKQSSVVNIIFTSIEFIGLLMVIYVGIRHIGEVNLFEMPEQGFTGLMIGASLSYFAYVGFEDIVKLSEETKKPEKKIPIALFASSAIVATVYILVAICSVSVLSWQELDKTDHPLSDVVETHMGITGLTIVAFIALFSTSNTILSNMMGSSRVLREMGEESRKLKWLAFVSPKRQIPFTALVFIGLLMIAFAAIGKLETVAFFANFFVLLTFLLVNIAVIILRKKCQDVERPFRIPFNFRNIPLTAVIGIAFTLLLVGYNVYALITGIHKPG